MPSQTGKSTRVIFNFHNVQKLLKFLFYFSGNDIMRNWHLRDKGSSWIEMIRDKTWILVNFKEFFFYIIDFTLSRKYFCFFSLHGSFLNAFNVYLRRLVLVFKRIKLLLLSIFFNIYLLFALRCIYQDLCAL